MGILKKLNNWLKKLEEKTKNDPVIHCNVYRAFGCAHVDGPHCNIQKCKITVAAIVTPNEIQIG